MKEIEVFSRGNEINNNGYSHGILDMYSKELKDTDTLHKYSYSQAEFDLGSRKRDSWSLNETIQKLYDLDPNATRRMFLDEYFSFMKKRGAVVTKIPVVAKLPLDLYRLYNAVNNYGGYAQVVKKRKWSRVVRDLGLPPSITSAAYTLRTQYLRLLYHFECEKKGVVANNLFFYEEQESIKQWSPGPVQQYDSSPPPKRYRSEDHDINKTDELDRKVFKEENTIQATFVELPRDQKDYSSVNLDEENINRPKSSTPPFMKRSRSEELVRRHSSDEKEVLNSRSASLDDLLKRAEKAQEKKKQGNEGMYESSTTVEDDKENQETRMPDDRKSIGSISPVPNSTRKIRYDDYIGAGIRRHSSNTMFNRQVELRQNSNSDDVPCSTENYKQQQRPRYTEREERGEEKRYQNYQEQGRTHSIYPPNITQSKVTSNCRCDECDSSQKNGGFPTGGVESKHTPYQNLPSPSRMLSKNGLSSVSSQYLSSSPYDRHLKRQYDMDEHQQRFKRYNSYRMPAHKNVKLSTNPEEMSLKIKERTENAIVLSIVVDGIYYSGTLLTSLKR